jgi:hypothetical protein
MPSGETKFFVSYAREDAQFALKLANDLRAAGVNLWVDQLDIPPGAHWDTAVEEALEACAGMVLILSPDAVASNNVKDEVARALESGKRLVPIVIRECKIPFRLGRVQYIDLAAAGEQAGLAQVRAALLRQAVFRDVVAFVAPPAPSRQRHREKQQRQLRPGRS